MAWYIKKNNLSLNEIIFFGLIFSTVFILTYNIFHYAPILGYDAEAHNAYVDFVARYLPNKFILPTSEITREFFNPPVGYIFPSIAQVICRNVIESSNFLADCQPLYGKATQVLQAILYLLTIGINLYTLKLFNNSKSLINPSYFLLTSLLAVNYRTISMIRGEPYILFFMSIFMLQILLIENKNYKSSTLSIISMGFTIAALALSRQWAFLLFIPVVVITFIRSGRISKLRFWFPSAVTGFILSGWFYLNLYFKYGSFTAFNMTPTKILLTQQNLNVFIPNYEQMSTLFTKPIRPFLDNQFLTILYSDLWGDYWGYFSFTSRYLDIGRDQLMIGDFLGRVNILSLFTSMIIITFCFLTHKYHKSNYFIRYVSYAIISSFVGYLIFFILFPTSSGDTIKATYIIQAFHLMVFLASIYLNNLKEKNKKIYFTILTILIIIYTHNYQTYLSHFPINFLT